MSERLINFRIWAILIAATEPSLNLQQERFGKDAVRYLQVRDEERLPPTQEQMLRDVWKNLDNTKAVRSTV